MPDESVFCSIIVATLGNPHLLLRCLDSIESAREFSREVPTEAIVILQGRADHQFARHFRGRVRLERIERKGLSFARNRGIGLARGEYLFFMDDDAVLARNAVKVLRDAAGAGDTAAICGQVVELETGRPYVLNYPRLARQTLGWRDFQRFAGSCHAVSRKTFDKIGLYDERFGVGGDYPAGEETDLFYRLLEAGEQVRYVPELVVHHPSARGFTLEKIFAYAFGNGALHAKHAWMNGLVPRHYRSFIRLLLVNCMKLIIGICVRLEWDRVAWTKAAGNIRGYIDYVSKRTDRCNLDHSKRIGLV